MATTLAQLRARVRLYVNEPLVGTATDGVTFGNAEIDQNVNNAQRFLWQTLCKSDSSFGLREAIAATIQGQTDYSYPSDILGRNIRALFMVATADATGTLEKIEKDTVENVLALGMDEDSPERYVCLDGYFKVGPPPDAEGYTFHIFYSKDPATLATGTDEMDSDDELADIIALDAAIQCLRRVNANVDHLTQRYSDLVNEAVNSMTADDMVASEPAPDYRY